MICAIVLARKRWYDLAFQYEFCSIHKGLVHNTIMKGLKSKESHEKEGIGESMRVCFGTVLSEILFFLFKIIFLFFLNHFNLLISKIIF